MPKMPKEKPEIENKKDDASKKSSWSDDQKQRGYYYDDAHGYEIYVPPDVDEEIEDGEAA